eukprot:3476577-Prorocentrum_lima.AAC.1
MQPKLRNPSSTWDIVDFVKVMTGEVRVSACEEEVESKMRPTLTNRFTTTLAASSMSPIPTAAGVEGITNNVCQ